MVLESCPKLSRANRLVNSQMSNKELQSSLLEGTKAVKNDQDSKGVEPRLRGGMLCSRGGVG